jgi:hypothetical protein
VASHSHRDGIVCVEEKINIEFGLGSVNGIQKLADDIAILIEIIRLAYHKQRQLHGDRNRQILRRVGVKFSAALGKAGETTRVE